MAGNDSMTTNTPLGGAPQLDTSSKVAGIEVRTGLRPEDAYRRDDVDSDRKAKLEAADKAEEDAVQARIKLDETRRKGADSHLTDEQRTLRTAEQEADDAHAKAVAARRVAGRENPRTVGDARVGAPVDPNLPAGHHRAQKFGNDPANPKSYKGEQDDPEKQTTRMTLRSPDTAEPRETFVHPDMVGNYARAGWEADTATT